MERKFVFCPHCHNLLTLNTNDAKGCYRFDCFYCPFVENITQKYVHRSFVKSEVDVKGESEIVDAEKEKQRRQKTQVICPECSHTEAYFHQMQTRSADEPMTNFYECVNNDCKFNWRD